MSRKRKDMKRIVKLYYTDKVDLTLHMYLQDFLCTTIHTHTTDSVENRQSGRESHDQVIISEMQNTLADPTRPLLSIYKMAMVLQEDKRLIRRLRPSITSPSGL